MRCKILLLLCALSSSACASSEVAPQPSKDAAPHDDRDASLIDASDADASRSDAALEPDASDQPDASEPECPPGTTRQYIGFAAECPRDDMECFEIGDRITCMRYLYTAATCADAGGTVVNDLADGCPADTSILGTIDDVSLCCRDIRSCAPQLVQRWDKFEATGRWYWDGNGCAEHRTIGCMGPDCERLFATESECLAAYAECAGITRTCGVGSGGSCFEDEYCAYPPGDGCGGGDASAKCQPHPTSCDDVYDPVCACDGKTYANPCEAARADKGIFHLGSCESFEDYCTAPCGLESDDAVVAACEGFTTSRECFGHALDDSDGAVPEHSCRWTNDYYATDCP